jgi:hydroxymethylglutaryl-CoA synthase
MGSFGILSYGAYVPRKRMSRAAIYDAVGWAQPAIKAFAKGHRAFSAWDEDAITMAVEASRNAVRHSKTKPSSLCFASTTAPFLDRQNAGVITTALDLPAETLTYDVSGSQRAATSALIQLCDGGRKNTLLVAADKRPVKSAGVLEMLSGDAAAAIIIGEGDPILKVLGAHAVYADLVDHYRTAQSETDYVLEERWVRDEGVMKLVPQAVKPLLEKAGVSAGDIAHLIAPMPNPTLARAAADAIGADASRLSDSLFEKCGHAGVAHPILQLAATIDNAKPGEKILLIGFGQGCDAILLEATPAIADAKNGAVANLLDNALVEENYTKFLAARGGIDIEWGMRAERDNRTAQTVAYDKARDLYGLVGGLCEDCGTPQFPKSRRCVNPECSALDRQKDYRFADRKAKVKSYTEDWLAFTREPPLIYGNISFEGGGNLFIEMCGFAPGEVSIGTPVEMYFRIKDIDPQRGFHRYFWKAGPVMGGGHA